MPIFAVSSYLNFIFTEMFIESTGGSYGVNPNCLFCLVTRA